MPLRRNDLVRRAMSGLLVPIAPMLPAGPAGVPTHRHRPWSGMTRIAAVATDGLVTCEAPVSASSCATPVRWR